MTCCFSISRLTFSVGAVLGLMCTSTPLVLAQDGVTSNRPDSDALERMQSNDEQAPVLEPESDTAQSSHTDTRIAAGMLVGEGAFLSGVLAEIVEIEGGGWAVRLYASDGRRVQRVMVAQPTERLEEMLRFIERTEERTLFRLSGQVFAYRTLNYLMVTAYTIANDTEATETANVSEQKTELDTAQQASAPENPETSEESSTDAPDTGPTGGLIDPEPVRRPGLFELFDLQPSASGEQGVFEIDDDEQTDLDRVFEQVESDGDSRSPVLPEGSGVTATGSSAATTRSGTILSRQSGRLVRGEFGTYMFVIDNDSDSAPSSSDAPLTVLPCQLLEAMEAELDAFVAGSPRIILSGRVYIFQGQGFVMPAVYGIEVDLSGGVSTVR